MPSAEDLEPTLVPAPLPDEVIDETVHAISQAAREGVLHTAIEVGVLGMGHFGRRSGRSWCG